jgi:hypothetical protein
MNEVANFVMWIIAILVIGVLILMGGYMIGNAVYDNRKQGVEISIQCIKAGGNPVSERGKDFECRK